MDHLALVLSLLALAAAVSAYLWVRLRPSAQGRDDVVWPGWARIRAVAGNLRPNPAQSDAQGRAIDRPIRYVYVAGPVTSSGTQVDNLRAAIRAGEQLHQRGFVPVIPHLIWSWELMSGGVGVEQRWYEITADWLLRCDALLRIPGHSVGADQEIALATDRGIPVFYDLDELVVVAEVDPFYAVRQSLSRLATDVEEWRTSLGWVETDPKVLILGIQEELGELARLYVKRNHDIRDDVTGSNEAQFKKQARIEIADVLIFALGYCTAEGIDVGDALVDRWQHVRNRDPNRRTAECGVKQSNGSTGRCGLLVDHDGPHSWGISAEDILDAAQQVIEGGPTEGGPTEGGPTEGGPTEGGPTEGGR